ncbi:hypothetical protein HNQ51_002123 [Inhella inkyongensis]|uniref:SH3 domain-containing protein n=1 Tax=Inhella inkyongensis TaxID=392593 RepID=A0A840S8R5_9BURK|nr:hypothetical protein [Inhella inkyongensis]MBB5204809.1 hypothetical protein [Inhella inkyongensis]
MTLRYSSVLLLVLLACSGPGAAQTAGAYRWIHSASLDVRESQSPNSKLLHKMGQGQRLVLLRSVGAQCEVREGDTPGRPQPPGFAPPLKGWAPCANLAAQPLPMPDERWVASGPLLVRTQAAADAPVQARLQQGSRVQLITPGPEEGYCEVGFGGFYSPAPDSQRGFVACRFLSPRWVATARAGEAGVPAERRWVAGAGVLLRAAAQPQAEVLARLPLNTEMNLRIQPAPDASYCAVQTQIPTQPPQDGFVACKLLARSPVAPERIGVRAWERWGAQESNPEYNPRQLFALEPSWDWMAHYETQQGHLCEGAHCPPRDPDFETERGRMRQALHGQMIAEREPPPPLRSLAELDGNEWTSQGPPDFPRQGPLAAARMKAFLAALPLQTPAPSWFRSEAELASPATPLAQLAERFNAQQRWYVGALLNPQEWAEARIERLTKPLVRVELFSDGRVRAQSQLPQKVRREWRPDVDYMCDDWPGEGFAFGDMDAATAKRNGWQAPSASPRRLFWFYSSRPLTSAAKALGGAERVALKREQHGFTRLELRRFDLDGDGQPDLLWAEATGRAAGPLDGPPKHDDPWLRLLFVNLAGQWKLLGSDVMSYGCGC